MKLITSTSNSRRPKRISLQVVLAVRTNFHDVCVNGYTYYYTIVLYRAISGSNANDNGGVYKNWISLLLLLLARLLMPVSH